MQTTWILSLLILLLYSLHPFLPAPAPPALATSLFSVFYEPDFFL